MKTLIRLNEKIENSGLSRYKISQLSEGVVSKAMLSRIKNNPNCDPNISVIEKIEEIIKKHKKRKS